MDAVTLSMAQNADRDYRGSFLRKFDPARDVRGLLAWWDASELTGADGSAVRSLSDKSGNNNVMLPIAGGGPTVKAPGRAGKSTMAFTSTQALTSQLFASRWDQSTLTQPYTIIAVAKAASSGPTAAARTIVGSGASSAVGVLGLRSNQMLALSGSNGTYLPYGGRTLNDDSWHAFGGRWGTAYGETYVDGYLTSMVTTQAQGSNPLGTGIALGAIIAGGTYFPWVGEIAEVLVFSGALPLKAIERVHAYLAEKWDLPTAPAQDSVVFQDTTDAGGQAVRVFWSPEHRATSMPLVIHDHAQGGTTNVTPSFYTYPTVYALANAGFVVAVPNNHGADSWTNDAAALDQPAARTAVASLLGITVSDTVLIGTSMGGALATIVAKEGRLPDLRGVYLVDAAVNLAWMYANGYNGSINTAFGISSVGQIPAGKDPATLTSGQLPAGLHWRAIASPNDATVSKTNNTDVLAPIIAGSSPAEWTSLTHVDAHLGKAGFLPDDIVAFAQRSIA